jgi:hypothetical protein
MPAYTQDAVYVVTAMSVPRDRALDVALSTRDDLQRAIDSAKHSRANGTRRNYMRIRDIMYGGTKPTKTLAIHTSMSIPEVECVWYSLSTVTLKDVYTSMGVTDTGGVVVTLSQDRMYLYSVDIEQVCKSLSDVCASITQAGTHDILLFGAPANVVNTVVRSTSLDCTPSDWECHDGDVVVTVFHGDKYMNVLRHCDVTLSTDASLNVSYMGKVRSCMLYRKYVSGEYVDLMVGSLLCSHTSLPAYDYSTVARSDPIKRLTVRELIKSMVSMALSGDKDDLGSPESSLMVRGTMPHGSAITATQHSASTRHI